MADSATTPPTPPALQRKKAAAGGRRVRTPTERRTHVFPLDLHRGSVEEVTLDPSYRAPCPRASYLPYPASAPHHFFFFKAKGAKEKKEKVERRGVCTGGQENFFFFLAFLGPLPRLMEVSRLGVESEF